MNLPRLSAALGGLGLVLSLTGHSLDGSVPPVATNQWAAGPALVEARAGATATSLGDGNVLVAGGRGASGPLASVEMLTSTGTAAPVGAMSRARAEHTAALLGDTGNILVAGGTTIVATEEGTAEVVTGSVEVFDAAAAAWYPVGSLAHPRAGATAVALPEGRIAIVGGHDANGPVLEIEIYDPSAGAFAPGGATSAPRAGAAVTSTRHGHILVVGGLVAGVAQATADIIDPVGGTVATVALTSPRTGASATTTVEDQILIAGGSDGTTALSTTEVLDPLTGNSTSGATLNVPRTDHRAYLLPHNGSVLLVGGSNAGGMVAASEMVIPWVNATQALGPVADPRSKTAGAAGPQDGVFVVAGGSTAAGQASGSSDYFGFATVKTDKDDYAPGEFVTITGSGWQPGETVNLTLHEVGTGAPDTPLNAVVLEDGTFLNDFWAPNESHLGVRFYLTATGAGATAQTTFTDNKNLVITFVGAGGGTIAYSGVTPAELPCTSTCSRSLDNNATGTLTVTPNPGSLFAGWAGTFVSGGTTTCSGTITPCTFSMSNTAQALTATFNRVTPAVVSIVRNSASPTNAAAVIWSVTFNQSVTGVNAGDFSLTATGFSVAPSITGLSVSGATYTVTANTGGGTGNIALNLVDDDSIQSAALPAVRLGGTGLGNGNFSGESYSVDRTLTPSITVGNKVYDGTTAATILTRTFTSNLAVAEAVSVAGGTATFNNKDVGIGKVVTAAGLTLTGAQASKYVLSATTAAALADITPKAASATANVATKEYGAADPILTGALTGFLVEDGVTATYSRTAGETVAGSPYTISAVLAPAGVLGNYTVTYNTAAFTITPRPASVTPDVKTKVYGDADPALTGTLTNFLPTDGVTATYARTAGETVAGSPYTISAALAPEGVLGNYTVIYNTAALTITPRPVSVTPNAATKVYGDADPALTGALTNFLAGDGVTATYSRTAAETVAGSPYAISAVLAPAGVLGNYTVTYNTAAFTITAKAASVTPNAATKEYGALDPTLSGTLTGFLPGDAVAATYSRTAGETVLGSPYTLSAVLSPAGVLSNYTITYNTAPFAITPRAASVTPNAATKEYGAVDPTLTGTLSGFLAGDAVAATYTRTAGETVLGGPYTISAVLSPAGVLSNYTITYNTAPFAITPRAASVTPNAATKEYGALDPSFSGTLTGFLPGDAVVATYTRAVGETVLGSPYTISATLAPLEVLSNYTIAYNTAAFTISAKLASVTPAVKTKVYGETDPALTGTLSGFLAGDAVTAAYSRTPGESVAASPYTTSAVLSPAAVLTNYTITYNTAAFAITKRPATWKTTDNTKILGAADPNPVTTGNAVAITPGTGFLTSDSVTATYSRAAGETVPGNPYHITATLNASAGVLDNYTITNAGASFRILYRWDGFLQPINDTAHQTGLTQSRFKAGQTVPAKFVIKNAAGQAVTQATNPLFTRSGNLGPCDPNTSPENPEPVTPDVGAEYKYSGDYHYNWSTKGLSSGVYKIYAILSDGTQRWVDICLTR